MKAFIFMGMSALAFSVCPLFYAITMGATDPISQGLFVQIAISAVAAIVLIKTLKTPQTFIAALLDLFKMPISIWSPIVLSGVIAYIGTLFFLASLTLMSPAGASVIMECWPILAIFMAPLLIDKQWKPFVAVDILLIVFLMLGLVFVTAGSYNMSLTMLFTNPLQMFAGEGIEGLLGVLCALLSAFCYAWAGVLRPHFVNLLPNRFRNDMLGGAESWRESLFAFWVTGLTASPLALIAVLIFGLDIVPAVEIIWPTIGLGIALTAMGCFYALALTLAKTPNVNFLWYASPVMAAVWLALFGYSQITMMLVIGGSLIILANFILIIKSIRQKDAQ